MTSNSEAVVALGIQYVDTLPYLSQIYDLILRSSEPITGPTIEVLVGNPPETFIVHENLIRKSSPFFENAMHGPWTESRKRKIPLKDEDPKVFAIYIQWLYRGPEIPVVPEAGDRYFTLSDAYIMGDMLQDNSFKDAVLESLHAQTGVEDQQGNTFLPGAGVVSKIYEKTPESSGIRRYLVDLYTHVVAASNFRDCSFSNSYPSPFLFFLVSELMRFRDKEKHLRQPLVDLCPYHSHSQDKPCIWRQLKGGGGTHKRARE